MTVNIFHFFQNDLILTLFLPFDFVKALTKKQKTVHSTSRIKHALDAFEQGNSGSNTDSNTTNEQKAEDQIQDILGSSSDNKSLGVSDKADSEIEGKEEGFPEEDLDDQDKCCVEDLRSIFEMMNLTRKKAVSVTGVTPTKSKHKSKGHSRSSTPNRKPNPDPNSTPLFQHLHCEMIYWPYSVVLKEDQQTDTYFCVDVIMPSGSLTEDCSAKVNDCRFFVSFFFDIPPECCSTTYLTVCANVDKSDVYAQALADVQTESAQQKEFEKEVREMMISLPFKCEVSHHVPPLVLKMLNKCLNRRARTNRTNCIHESIVNIYRVVLKKAATRKGRKTLTTNEVTVDSLPIF